MRFKRYNREDAAFDESARRRYVSNHFNAAMALQRLNGWDERIKKTIKAGDELIAALNKTSKITINRIEGGTNIHSYVLSKDVNSNKMIEMLDKEYNIRIGRPNSNGEGFITINESILHRTTDEFITAFKKATA